MNSFGTGLIRQEATAAVKTGAVEYTNAVQGFPVDSNRYNGFVISNPILVRRYNHSIVRWPANWPLNTITFEIQCTSNVNSDMRFPVYQGGVQIAVITGTTAMDRKIYTVPVTANGGLIEVWEPWFTRDGAQNQGTDGPVNGGYITAVWGQPRNLVTPAQCTDCVVVIGESIIGAIVPSAATFGQNEVQGVAGLLRQGAHSQGKLCVTMDYGGGTLRGDGITPAQYAALILQGVASTGATRAVVHFNITRNDWFNYGATVSSTPTQCATDLQTILNTLYTAMGANIRFVVATPVPQSSEAANGGGFTLGAYRTAINTLVAPAGSAPGTLILLDSSTMGLIVGSGPGPAVDFGDGVHMNIFGCAKYYAKAKGPVLGL